MHGSGTINPGKLWVFGQSMSLPYNISSPDLGWPNLLSTKLNIECKNYAEPGADNFFIYHTFLENVKNISSEDIVVIGWSHPSRKSFVVNDNNTDHQKASEHSLIYKTKTKKLIRSNHTAFLDNQKKWEFLKPLDSGTDFYDNWFKNYYSLYEQTCNFLSYFDSVSMRCPGIHIPFFFSKESKQNLDLVGAGDMLDFIIDNNVAISKDDCHLNEYGHQLWADHIHNYIKKVKNA